MYKLFFEDDLVLYAWIDDVCENKLTIFERAVLVRISWLGKKQRKLNGGYLVNNKRNVRNVPVGKKYETENLKQ